MSVRVRIAAILLLEKMEHNEAYCEKLGLSDASKLHGEIVNKKRDGLEDFYDECM